MSSSSVGAGSSGSGCEKSTAAESATPAVRPALSVVPLSVQLSRDNAAASSSGVSHVRSPSKAAADYHGAEDGGQHAVGKRRAARHATPPAPMPLPRLLVPPAAAAADGELADDNSDSDDTRAGRTSKRARANSPAPAPAPATDPAAVTATVAAIATAPLTVARPPHNSLAPATLSSSCSSASYASLLCTEELTPDWLSAAASPNRATEPGESSLSQLMADYCALQSQCYHFSCAQQRLQHDSSQQRLYAHALQARCAAIERACTQHPTRSAGGGCVPLALYDSTVSLLLAERIQLSRAVSSHRRLWFELLERRVQQREETLTAVQRGRAADREQWRSKQRALEHEVSRLRVELQLHNAVSQHAASDVYIL